MKVAGTLLSGCSLIAIKIAASLRTSRLRNQMPDLTRYGAILLLGRTLHKFAEVRR